MKHGWFDSQFFFTSLDLAKTRRYLVSLSDEILDRASWPWRLRVNTHHPAMAVAGKSPMVYGL